MSGTVAEKLICKWNKLSGQEKLRTIAGEVYSGARKAVVSGEEAPYKIEFLAQSELEEIYVQEDLGNDFGTVLDRLEELPIANRMHVKGVLAYSATGKNLKTQEEENPEAWAQLSDDEQAQVIADEVYIGLRTAVKVSSDNVISVQFPDASELHALRGGRGSVKTITNIDVLAKSLENLGGVCRDVALAVCECLPEDYDYMLADKPGIASLG